MIFAMILWSTAFFVWQVRESIGVTLSVLCSNFQLYRSLCEDHSHEGEISDVHDQIWVESLAKQASEMVIRIQSSGQSDILGSSSTTSHENGCGNNSQEDVKWMETVLLENNYTSFCSTEIFFNMIFFWYAVIPLHNIIFEVWKIFLFA